MSILAEERFDQRPQKLRLFEHEEVEVEADEEEAIAIVRKDSS